MKTNISTAPIKPIAAIINGFLSNKINELKKNKTNDSSWTLISIFDYPACPIAPNKRN